MRHILVETNWVVDWAAPAHHQQQSAVNLFDAAAAGRCWLHIPAISLAEARPVIRKRFKLSDELDGLALFSRQLLDEGTFTRNDHQHVHRFLNLFQDRVRKSFEGLEARLEQLRNTPQVEVFALSEVMLERSIALSNQHGIELDPFDNSILAAIIERATSLAAEGVTDLVFATKDAHLLPRFRNGKLKEELDTLYRGVGLEVVDGFGRALAPSKSGDEE